MHHLETDSACILFVKDTNIQKNIYKYNNDEK